MHSLLSLLSWVRLDTEPSLAYQSSELIKLAHLTIAPSKA